MEFTRPTFAVASTVRSLPDSVLAPFLQSEDATIQRRARTAHQRIARYPD